MVLVIASVLAALTLPSLAGVVARQRSQGAVQRLVATLHHARDEAIKRNGRVVVCKSADARRCSLAGGWEQGWLMFHDRNNDAQIDTDEALIAQAGPLEGSVRIRGNGPVANYVSYGANGAARLVSGAFQAGALLICPAMSSGAVPTRIVLSPTGRPRLGPAAVADCQAVGAGGA